MDASRIKLEIARLLASFPLQSKTELRIGEDQGHVRRLELVLLDSSGTYDEKVENITFLLPDQGELERMAIYHKGDPGAVQVFENQLTFLKGAVVPWYLSVPAKDKKKVLIFNFISKPKTVKEKVEEGVKSTEDNPASKGEVDTTPIKVKKPGRKKEETLDNGGN